METLKSVLSLENLSWNPQELTVGMQTGAFFQEKNLVVCGKLSEPMPHNPATSLWSLHFRETQAQVYKGM